MDGVPLQSLMNYNVGGLAQLVQLNIHNISVVLEERVGQQIGHSGIEYQFNNINHDDFLEKVDLFCDFVGPVNNTAKFLNLSIAQLHQSFGSGLASSTTTAIDQEQLAFILQNRISFLFNGSQGE